MRADLEISSQEHYQIKNDQRSVIGKILFRNALEREYRETTQGKGA